MPQEITPKSRLMDALGDVSRATAAVEAAWRQADAARLRLEAVVGDPNVRVCGPLPKDLRADVLVGFVENVLGMKCVDTIDFPAPGKGQRADRAEEAEPSVAASVRHTRIERAKQWAGVVDYLSPVEAVMELNSRLLFVAEGYVAVVDEHGRLVVKPTTT